MSKWPIEWIVVIGLALLFIAVKYPLLLMEAAVLIAVWTLLSKSAPESVKREKKDGDFIPADEKSPDESKGSDAFYAEASKTETIYDRSAKFVVPERPIEKSIE